jgi:NAD(P)-dependent dehydrogenase (short-subunit alcohol dehydrogenase family)
MARHIERSVVAITGASSGIGAAMARELHHRGARLALCARRTELLDSLNASLGGSHFVMRCDVSDPAQCESFVARAADHFGRLDTLVCNAGYGMIREVVETSHEDVRRMFQTNVFGTIDCLRPAAKLMAAQEPRDGWRGQIMIVSSAAARRGVPYLGCYSATKYAQLGLAEALRVELAPQRIAVTSVHPISTSTEFGQVAEREGTASLPPSVSTPLSQTAEHVARRMADAIRRPRRELWPAGFSKWFLALNAMFPALGDWAMEQMRAKTQAWNRRR